MFSPYHARWMSTPTSHVSFYRPPRVTTNRIDATLPTFLFRTPDSVFSAFDIEANVQLAIVERIECSDAQSTVYDNWTRCIEVNDEFANCHIIHTDEGAKVVTTRPIRAGDRLLIESQM